MPRRQLVLLLGIVALTVAASVLTVVWRNEPLLGLDLQGGVSVRLVAVGPTDEAMLDQTVEIIRDRIDGLGVAEPEISRTETGVMVSLPGVDDQERALTLVGTTAELRFRPVCRMLNFPGGATEASGTAPPGPASCALLNSGEVVPSVGPGGVTPPEDDHPTDFVVLGARTGSPGARYVLGPSLLTGEAIAEANPLFIDYQWQVGLDLRAGRVGIDGSNSTGRAP